MYSLLFILISSSKLGLRNMLSKVNNLVYLKDGLIAFISEYSNIITWDLKNSSVVNRINISSFAIAFISETDQIISCDSNGEVSLIDYKLNKIVEKHNFTNDSSSIFFLFNSLGNDLFALGSSEEIFIVNINKGTIENKFTAKSNEIISLSNNSQSNNVVIGTVGNGVYQWDYKHNTVSYIDINDYKFENVLYLENDKFAYSSIERERLEIWSIKGDFIESFGKGHRAISSIVNINNDLIVSGNYYGDLRIWNLRNGALIHESNRNKSIYDMIYIQELNILVMLKPIDQIDVFYLESIN